MFLRITFVLAFTIFILNLRFALGIPGDNVIEKGAFLLAAVCAMTMRKCSISILLLMALNLLLVIIFGAFTDYPMFQWGILIFALNQFVIIYAFLAFQPTRADCFTFLTTIALIPIASVALGALYQVVGLHNLYAREYSTGLYRMSGSVIPAYLSGLSMCGVVAALYLAIGQKRSQFWAVCFLNLMILLLAGGRAALVTTVIVSASVILFTRGVNTTTRLWSIGVALFAAPAFAIVFGGKILERFLTSGENGRDLAANFILGLSAKYPLIGIGFGHQFLSTPREVMIMIGSAAAHNDYLRLQLEIGKIGMPLMYALLTLAVCRAAYRNGRVDVTVIVAWMGYLLLSHSDNVLATPAYFPLIVIAVLAARLTGNDVADAEPLADTGRSWRLGATSAAPLDWASPRSAAPIGGEVPRNRLWRQKAWLSQMRNP